MEIVYRSEDLDILCFKHAARRSIHDNISIETIPVDKKDLLHCKDCYTEKPIEMELVKP